MTMFSSPVITADIVLLNREASVLLIQRQNPPFAHTWALPGGKLEPGESLERCAQRELYEETGIYGLPLLQFRTYSTPGRDPRGHVISTVYVAHLDMDTSMIPLAAGDDALAVQWFSLSCLPALAFDHQQIIEEVMQARHAEQQMVARLLHMQKQVASWQRRWETELLAQ